MTDTLPGLEATRAPESLPPYSVRVSPRARRVRLVVTPREGLVVVVPARWRGDVAAIVAEKRAWAERALAHAADDRALFSAGPEALLPSEVELPFLPERWRVEYRATDSSSVRAAVSGGALVVSGDIDDAEACLAALSRWLDRTAREVLLPALARTAADAGLPYASARVRRQRSRWGSCSSRRTISLNRNLVFLPEHLVRALMLHELAHTLVMNHSARYWTTLERFDPDAHEHRVQMKDAGRYVPAWADA